jgi:hypothetical protein
MVTFFVLVIAKPLKTTGLSSKVGGCIIDLRKPCRFSLVTNMHTLNLQIPTQH